MSYKKIDYCMQTCPIKKFHSCDSEHPSFIIYHFYSYSGFFFLRLPLRGIKTRTVAKASFLETIQHLTMAALTGNILNQTTPVGISEV